MGSCLKGKSKTDPHPGAFLCKKCKAVAEKKKQLCDPKKIKEKKEKGSGKASKEKGCDGKCDECE
ncbi:hypothetical protein [Chrysiogenes arsenatis]|uniref:hypothetical protein n=1 Tax=Chrysiogenes arsenatis TaxID=309797 RepID=UPI000418064D|nr:hypothetical protein [Chrysiogenes arsenatis]